MSDDSLHLTGCDRHLQKLIDSRRRHAASSFAARNPIADLHCAIVGRKLETAST